MAYAKQQKMSEWMKAQPDYLGAQGKTLFDPDFDIDDQAFRTRRWCCLRLFRDNGYRTFFVTGGGQDFVCASFLASPKAFIW